MKLAIVLTLPFVLLFTLVSSMSFLVVDVRESGPDGMHVIVPVPLVAVQIALAFVPPEHTRAKVPAEAREYLPMAEKAVAELAQAPDGELVRVEQPDERVLIEKRGDTLHVEVHGRDGDVSVNLPLSLATEILRHASGELSAADVVAGLRRVSRTDLVEVRDRGDHVKVWIW